MLYPAMCCLACPPVVYEEVESQFSFLEANTLRFPQRVSFGEVHLQWGTVSSSNNTVVLYGEQ